MKVHVITDRLDSDRILPRLAKYLAVQNGWSISETPDLSADFNYFNNYGTYHKACRHWHGTPMGAYFSHLDENNPGKSGQWHEVAGMMDACITTASLYHQYLPAEKVYQCRPPVEVEKFIIARAVKHTKPVVGVMGFTYGDGRKGERLFLKFTQSDLAKKLTLRASGRGWKGVRCEYHEWGDIQKYFQSLDVLLVPSLFEGVPIPPLEALACGIKVVLPSGVGLIDELPDIDGIYRYECGNVKAMEQAVERAAFSEPVNRKALRQIILDNYTVAHWAADHRQMIGDYFNQEDVSSLPDWKGNSGVYLVAFGDPSRECARRCIDSVHKYMPGWPVALAADKPIGSEDVFIKHVDADIGGRIAKLKCDELAPAEWKYILYFDADIEVMGDISFLFRVLQTGWELVLCKDNNKYGLVREMKRPDNLDECVDTWAKMGSSELLQYNGGVLAYRRSSNTKQFFERWQKEWNKYGKRDQGALLRALYAKPLRMFLLLNQWNATTRYELPHGDIAIKHHNMEARRWQGVIHERIDSPEAWAEVKKYRAKVRADA